MDIFFPVYKKYPIYDGSANNFWLYDGVEAIWFSRNHTLNSELWFFAGLMINNMVLFYDAEQWQQAAPSNQPQDLKGKQLRV